MKLDLQRLKLARHLKGLSLEETAEIAQMNVHALWRIENGHSQLKVQTFLKLMDVLEQPFTFFVKENQFLEPIGNKIDELKKILQFESLVQEPRYQVLLRALENLEK
ncbi:helix-turn-helix domain-containing protein [Cytobacillus spongiae]|uniref:helix-turn-helix domain-containing protein n=1 Tax=Cytobacillus spongiae TaxID=2901381 RepID=UPI001F1F2DB0|nr:helix-turn-helix transcriptional regulator [Cytobacillus spongiae]UII55533.1 helix-turn-helix domain-containing protein [Cytobacillus spongiae]